MKKIKLQINLPVSIFKEGKTYVAYTPALDLSTCAKSCAQVERRFNEIVEVFFEELLREGTLEEALSDLGWKKIKKEWRPPTVITQRMEKMKVAVG